MGNESELMILKDNSNILKKRTHDDGFIKIEPIGDTEKLESTLPS